MATYTFDKIEYGSNTYVVSDSGALQLTGGQVTGPVTFGDSVTIDEATLGDLVVNGSASFTNNIQANTINGVTVGSSPKFTDTNTEVSTLTLAAGSTAGTSLTSGGKFTLTAGSKTVSFTMPTIPTVPSNIVNTITTTAGAHTAITSQKGNVSFNVPTKTSHLTNDSGFLTSITHQTIKQDGVTGATGNHFGTCSIAAGTAAKTVSITAGTPALEAGLRVTVKFANANTAGTPTLNVNSLGAKNIFHNGAQITTGANKALLAGTVEFVYDGTQWQLVGNYIDTDTKAWANITGKPTATGSATTEITATTTATKTTLGTAFTIPNVTSVGTLPSLTTTSFEIPNISVESVSVVSDIDVEQGEASCSLVATESDNQVESTDYCLNLSDQQPITDITKTTASLGSASEGAAFDIEGVDTWSEGTTPSLGTDITVKEVDS